jgi:hemerythrin-like domain-containing protein
MKNAYEGYSLGLRLSHLALLRNLDRFVELAERGTDLTDRLSAFVALYVDFLDVHHRSEDDFTFPALRRHTAGKSTDAAHLDRWSTAHRDISRLGHELSGTARRLRDSGHALSALGRTSRELKDLLVPHVASEEQVLSPAHLPEMIPEQELAATTGAIARANRSNAIAMASFLASSLEPGEQKALLGDTPWIFRKFLLGFLGARRMRRYRSLVHAPSIAL